MISSWNNEGNVPQGCHCASLGEDGGKTRIGVPLAIILPSLWLTRSDRNTIKTEIKKDKLRTEYGKRSL